LKVIRHCWSLRINARLWNELDFERRQAYGLILELLERANEAWLGWEGEAIITEAGSRPGTWKGRNFAYKQVVVRSGESLLGRKVNVKVESVDSVNLYARLKQFP